MSARRVFSLPAGGWGYEILDIDGSVLVRQLTDPDLSGDQAMTKARAEACADKVLGRLNASPAAVVEMEPIDFVRLFTQDERIAIRQAARLDPRVEDYEDQLAKSKTIILTDPGILAGVPLLEAYGLIGPGRAARILRGLPPE